MFLTRREFARGAAGAALATQVALPARAQDAKYASALAAIRAYGRAHVDHFNIPGMTLGLTTADGFSTILDFGHADLERQTPITPQTLFQIGSISKLINAAVIHQLATEGRLRLTGRVSDLLPGVPLPADNRIEVQHLLDHVAGLPSDAPVFAEGGLWTGYAPGTHWHYSNTGYDILGRMIERIAGKPLARVLDDRVFKPLGMSRSRGAIVGADRLLYAQGYEAADQMPFALGVPLAPAAWIDVTFAAGNVASTADDMNRLMRSLAGAVQGRSGLGLPTDAARAFTGHAVPSDDYRMRYGNGLMHVANGDRRYLHHTGGMVSFTSSFHLDIDSGTGAFASSTLGALSEYRPRSLTRFAVDALTSASLGKTLPVPPSLYTPSMHTPAYLGRYEGPTGAFEIRKGNPLTIVAGGQSASLQPWGGELFRTTHPAFRAFSFLFERRNNVVTLAHWGSASFGRIGTGAKLPVSDPALAKLAGRYVNDSPWLGLVQVAERGGKLWLGTEVPMTPTGPNLWRIGQESWSPERGSFSDHVDGLPRTFTYSGEKFARHEV